MKFVLNVFHASCAIAGVMEQFKRNYAERGISKSGGLSIAKADRSDLLRQLQKALELQSGKRHTS